MLALARKSAEQESPDHEGIVRCQILLGNDLDSANAKLVSLVGEAKRVLCLGTVNPSLGRALQAQGCEVVSTHEAGEGSDRTGVNLGGSGLPGEVDVAGFDVVLAPGSLEHLRDPLAVLKAVKKTLRQEGYLVAAVPNVAHGNVRLALLGGQFPYSNVRAYQEAPLRFFTHDSLVSLLEEAEFAIGVVERQEEEVSVPEGLAGTTPAELLESVLQAPEARTTQFIVVAYPLPWRGLGWLQKQLHTLAEQCAAAKRDADEAREDLEAVNAHLRMLLEQQDGFLRREKDLRAQVVSVHEQLMRRDEELRQVVVHRVTLLSMRERLRHTLLGRAYRFARRLLKRVR